MDDLEVIDVFVNGGAKQAFGETLHIEGDVLLFDGYWHVCMRIGSTAFALRNEEPPGDTAALDEIAGVLKERGLSHVATDLPGITVLTMNKASLGYVSWHIWATDEEAGAAAVSVAVNEDSFFQTGYDYDTEEKDYNAELHGARRLAGLPTSVILSVGVDPGLLEPLGDALGDCVFVAKRFGEIEPDACGSLVPSLILVEASEQRGREFVMQLRAASCSRVLPVVAVTPDATTPLGADAAVGATEDPKAWARPIRSLLP